VARYLGIRNLFDGEVAGGSESCIDVFCPGLGQTIQMDRPVQDRGPALQRGDRVVIAIRSDEVKIIHPEFEQGEPKNPLHGHIEAMYGKGASHTLLVRAEGALSPVELEVGNRVMRKLDLSIGSPCTIDLKPNLLVLLPFADPGMADPL
jgi:ABC-type Fe3+/spermidine/putrescine transport system ATPase subunit